MTLGASTACEHVDDMTIVIFKTQTFFYEQADAARGGTRARTALARDPPSAAPALLLWPWADTAPQAPALREMFLAWPRVQAVHQERDQLSRVS